MVIYDIDGNRLLDAILTENGEHEEELGIANLVRLSWNSDVKLTIPAGSYIIPFPDGLKYRILNYYTPSEDNSQFKYTPEFHHPLISLSRLPFLYATKDSGGNDIMQQEWSFDGLTVTALEYACKVINDALGITDEAMKFTYTLCGTVDASVSFSVSSNDILSVLSSIAQACKSNDCEWHLSWEHRTLYFGQISINLGEEIPLLKVHDNLQTASVSESKDDYYNCFYPQGSTKNMSRKAQVGTGNVATMARLGLNLNDYPDGCMYVGTGGKIISKTEFDASNAVKQTLALSFDDIFPHIDLYAYNIRKRTRYLKNDTTGEYEKDSNGKNRAYTVWYMRLAYCTTISDNNRPLVNITTDKDEQGNNVTHYWYDYDLDKSKQVLQGYTLKGAFKVNTHATDNQYDALPQSLIGQPSGQDGFELDYHDEASHSIPASESTGDSGVTVLKGDYEIKMYQNGDVIVPTNEEDGLIPRGKDKPDLTCNIVVLFNIVMGGHEVTLAQEELASRAVKTIADRKKDKNNYTAPSNPVKFAKNNPKLYIGQAVTYDDGFGYQLTTRVIKLVTKLDYPIIQDITVGNQTIKGTISQLKEDVSNILSGNFSGGGLNYAQVSSIVKNYADPRFLRKDVPDTASGLITFLNGIRFGNGGKGIDGRGDASLGDVSGDAFTAGSVSSKGYTGEDILADRGFRMWEDADGKSHVMTDYFSARVKAFFASLEIRRIEHSAGNRIESPAGNTIAMVEGYTQSAGGYRKAEQGETVAFHRCYFMAEDKEKGITNDWRAGDQAFCQTFNLRQFRSDGTAYGVTNKRYWRLVISTGYAKIGDTEYGYIDLCNMIAWDIEEDGKVFHCVGYEDIAGIGVPEAGDGVACFGSQTHPETRGGAIQYITCGEADTGGLPCVRLYSGINGFTNLSRYLIEERNPRRVMARADKFEILSAAGTGASGGMTCFRGDWQPGVEYGRYDVVQHSGSSFLCTVDEGKTTTAEPSAASPDWTLFAARGGAAPVIDCDKGSVTIEADGDGGLSSADPLGAMPERFRVIHGGLPVTALDAAATYIKYKGRSVFLDGHSAGAPADGMYVSRLSVEGDGVAIMWQARFGIGSDGKEHPTPILIHAELVKDGERLSAGMAIPVIEQRAAREVMAEYSVTGNDGTWHTPFTEGDVFAHFSYDGGATWTDKVRIVGKSLEFKPADMHFAKWADYTEYFRTHLARQYTVIVSEDGKGRPAPSVVRYRAGDLLNGIPPSTDISAAPSGENYLTQSDGHLWNSQGAGKGWADMGRIEGKAGADGVSFVLSPATVIFEQDEKTLKVDTSGFSARVIGMSGTRMLAAGRDYTISKVTGTHCTAYADGGLVKIRGIGTQEGVGGDTYYPSGSVDVEISGIGSQKIHLTLNWAANLLGTWKQTVRNDVMEAVSNKQVTYVDKDGNTHTENLETLIRQNAEGVDLSAKVNDLETAGIHLSGRDSRIDLVAARTKFVRPDGRDMIRVGEDSDGFPYFMFMMPDGVTPAYNLGRMGVVDLINKGVQAGFGDAQPMRYLGTVAELGGGIGAEELYTACDGDVGETADLHAMLQAFRFTQARLKQSDGALVLVPSGVDDDGKYYDSNAINQSDGLPSGTEICRIGYVDAPGEVTLWIGAYTSQVGYRNRPELNPSTSLTRSFPVYYVHGSRVTRVERISVQFTVTQGRKGYNIQPLPSSGGDKYYPAP